MADWFQTAFKDFGEFPAWAWIVVAVLLVGGVIAYRSLKGGHKTVWNTKMMAMGAVCIALPLMLFSYVYGMGPGCLVGALYGVLQFIIEPYFLSLPQMLLDYPIAFGMMGLAGLFSKMDNENLGLTAGVVLASVGRFVAAVLSGVIFFAEYAGDQNPWVYSIVYNGSYMLPECIICVILCLAVGLRLARQLKKNK